MVQRQLGVERTPEHDDLADHQEVEEQHEDEGEGLSPLRAVRDKLEVEGEQQGQRLEEHAREQSSGNDVADLLAAVRDDEEDDPEEQGGVDDARAALDQQAGRTDRK